MPRLIDADALMDNIKNKCIMPDWCKTLIRAVVINLPSAQPEFEKRTAESAQNVPNGELISRKAVIEALATYIHNVDRVIGTGYLSMYDCRDAAESVIEELPSAQPERKKGKWEQVEVNYMTDMDADIKESMAIASMFCPVCKRYHNEVYLYGNPTYGVNFCPNCGADKRGKT